MTKRRGGVQICGGAEAISSGMLTDSLKCVDCFTFLNYYTMIHGKYQSAVVGGPTPQPICLFQVSFSFSLAQGLSGID